jgi:hypothetical protein
VRVGFGKETGFIGMMTYEETGHSLHWEQPERFIADLERFIQATNW